ncbi:MAG: SulP family inorganic anion transporter [Trueperaceae bacterium]
MVGLVVGATSVSLATLIFGPVVPDDLAHGIRLVLLGAMIASSVAAITGHLPGVVAQAQGAPAAILASLAVTTATTLPEGADPTVRFATVIALVATTSFAIGATFLALGALRLGRLVRYLPYPVIGGFVAGTGWLLVVGGASVAGGVGDAGAAAASALDGWGRWLPAVGLGALLTFAGTGRGRHPLVFPALLAAAIAVFFGAMAATGGTPAGWRAAGLLLDVPTTADRPLGLLGPDLLDLVHWPSWWLHLPGVATVVLVATMGLSFNTAGLEVALRRRVRLDPELRAAGLGNLAASAFGAVPAYPSMAAQLLALRLGGGRRTTTFAVVAVLAAGVVAGPAWIAWVPAPIVGGVLVSLGFGLLREWVIDAIATLSRLEYGIVLLILGVIAVAGLLPGVLVGLVLAVLLFVVSYSRVDAVKHVLIGSAARSRMRWDAQERRALDATADARLVLQLQGYLFFGVAYALLDRLERQLDANRTDEVVVDFRQVTGADATALASLDALRREAASRGARLVFAEVPPALARAFARRGVMATVDGSFAFAATLDAALEAAERRALTAAAGAFDPLESLSERLEALADDDLELQDLAAHLERLEIPAGQRIATGDAGGADAVYVVASGQVTTWLDLGDRAPLRLETFRGGNLVGDVGFYRGDAATTSWVAADEPTTLYRLTRARLTDLTAADPALAASFHRLAARQLAHRTAHLTRLVEALQR